MTQIDLDRLDAIKERLDNIPDVLELRVKIEWRKLSESEYDLLIRAYKELDDLLNEARAFMFTKFPNRQDLVIIWNEIDFDTKIGSLKINTNDSKVIRSSWLQGMNDFYSFIKTMRAEVILQIDDSICDHVQINKLNKVSIGEHAESISWQRKAIYVSVILAVVGLMFSYLIYKKMI